MSRPSSETIEKTARLALLEITPEQALAFERDLAAIFPLFDVLDHPDISALKPLGHPLGDTQPLREDIAVHSEMQQSLQENAPQYEDGFITVPKVIE